MRLLARERRAAHVEIDRGHGHSQFVDLAPSASRRADAARSASPSACPPAGATAAPSWAGAAGWLSPRHRPPGPSPRSGLPAGSLEGVGVEPGEGEHLADGVAVVPGSDGRAHIGDHTADRGVGRRRSSPSARSFSVFRRGLSAVGRRRHRRERPSATAVRPDPQTHACRSSPAPRRARPSSAITMSSALADEVGLVERAVDAVGLAELRRPSAQVVDAPGPQAEPPASARRPRAGPRLQQHGHSPPPPRGTRRWHTSASRR